MSTRLDHYEIPHRKNAAEWVMFVVVWPVVRLYAWIFTTKARRHGEEMER
jgi:hypothetical protein